MNIRDLSIAIYFPHNYGLYFYANSYRYERKKKDRNLSEISPTKDHETILRVIYVSSGILSLLYAPCIFVFLPYKYISQQLYIAKSAIH